MDSITQAIPGLLEHNQNVTYLHVASLALWVFEYLITMDMEIEYIWKSPHWSVVKVLYLAVRYGTYLDSCLNIVVQLFPSLSSISCKSLYNVTIWSIAIGMTTSEIILTFRVWAVWQKTRTMAIILTMFFIGILIPLYVNVGILGSSLTFAFQDLPIISGCLVSSARITLEEAMWGVLLSYDTVMMLFMLPPAYKAFITGGKTSMTKIVIRDGIIYYIYIFVLTLVNMVVQLKLSPDYFSLFTPIWRVVHSALCCRVVLNIREQGWKTVQVHCTTISGV
ncbi:hypothetical protein BDQ17DRAFT_1414103 [Cyathus striatus]|nr:hypothetical protein BDQ17DRAFT_1414103 [Cyathus striatus]